MPSTNFKGTLQDVLCCDVMSGKRPEGIYNLVCDNMDYYLTPLLKGIDYNDIMAEREVTKAEHKGELLFTLFDSISGDYIELRSVGTTSTHELFSLYVTGDMEDYRYDFSIAIA